MSIRRLFIIYSVVAMPVLLYSCGVGKNATEKANDSGSDSTYIFDRAAFPRDTVAEQPRTSVQNSGIKYYIVQIGAFTTKDKAESFAATARKELNYKVDISFSNTVNLYVVQLAETYGNKEEAEAVKNKLWLMPNYRDAWVLTVTK